MRFKIPKNTDNLIWTNHSIDKMKQYQLSEQRIRRVLNAPKRKEEGIAPNTVAIMQSTGTQKHPTEIWVMYQNISQPRRSDNEIYRRSGLRPLASENTKSKLRKIRIISAWRYPGVSPIRTVPNIPEEVWGILESPDLK